MPKPPNPGQVVPVNILLTASIKPGTVDEVVFKHKSPLLNGKKHEYVFNKINQGMDKNDYHEIRFKLVKDDTGMGLKLPTDVKDAFWVIDCSNGAKRCPGHTDTSDYSEFYPIRRADDTTLIVENYNEHERYWMFSVNFLKQLRNGKYDENDRANYACYDPGGVNQDYSVRSEFSALTVGAAGFVVGGIAALVVERFL